MMQDNQPETLDEAAVNKVLHAQGKPRSATASYSFTVSIYEKHGRAYISWSLDPGYLPSIGDFVMLREEGTGKTWTHGLSGRLGGEWDTGHTFGSGLTASIWRGMPVFGWKVLVLTPPT